MDEIEFNKLMFEQMLDILYHGTIRIKYTKNNFLKKIKIFDNVEQSNKYLLDLNLNKKEIRKNIGRFNLDGGFSGIYFTPNKYVAAKWATRVIGKKGQIVKVKVDKSKLLKSGIKIHCLPTMNWAKFIVRNRKHTTFENNASCSFTLQLDSKLKNNSTLFNNIQNCNLDNIEFLEDMYHDLFKKYKINDCTWNYTEIINDEDIKSGKYFHLCISSMTLLNCIEVIDIIDLE